jgi:hypothetical protein
MSSTENVAPLESTTTLRRAWMDGRDASASTTMPCPLEEAEVAVVVCNGLSWLSPGGKGAGSNALS